MPSRLLFPVAEHTGGITIARGRRFYRDTGPVRRTRVNFMIRISPIRVIGSENEQIGVIETQEALRMAQEQGFDLVEIVPDSRPPVCKIMDYGKYKYDLSQKERRNRAKSKHSETKEIRLGRSVKIDPHDVQIRVDQSRRFLLAGHKVQITQRFRGREMMHKELGIERLAQIVDDLSDIAKVEMPPRWAGRSASLLLAPDKPKVEAYKRRLEEERRAGDGPDESQEVSIEELEAQVEAQNLIDDPDDDDAADGAEVVAAVSEQPTKKKGKGPRDDRAKNPVDDELRELLG
ncbi:MAG: translation initiation factor IF-3 [Planctomycetota bacterium]|nr:translation initiation factor IF-3 [Planctomycetota bacterium]